MNYLFFGTGVGDLDESVKSDVALQNIIRGRRSKYKLARNNEDEGIKKFYYSKESPTLSNCSMVKLKNESIDYCSIDLEGIDFDF